MSDETKRSPQEERDAAVRRFCRQIASVILAAMSETDTSFTMIAAKIGKREKDVRGFVNDLADGVEGKYAMRELAEIFWAMDCVPKLTLTKSA